MTGARRPDLHRLDQRQQRQRRDHADLRERHQPGHRAGAGAEQAAAGDAAAAADRAAAGHQRQPRRSGSFLMVVGFVSEDGSMSAGDIGDYLATNVVDPLSRVDRGRQRAAVRLQVRHAHLARSGQAQRLRADAADVIAAIQAQNAQVSVGQLGGLPGRAGQQLNATVTALGRLHDARAVPQHRPAQQHRRLDTAPARRGARRTRTGRLRLRRCITTARRPPASASSWQPAPMRWRTVQGVQAAARASSRRSSRTGLRSWFPTTRRRTCASRSRKWSRRCFEAIVLVFLVM